MNRIRAVDYLIVSNQSVLLLLPIRFGMDCLNHEYEKTWTVVQSAVNYGAEKWPRKMSIGNLFVHIGGDRMRRIMELVAAAFLIGLLMVGTTLAGEPLKVGFVFIGPVEEDVWSYGHNKARLAVEEEFDGRVRTAYVESVPEGDEAVPVIRQLAAEGHRLIITTSHGYMNATIEVSKLFPDVYFEHLTGLGYENHHNVSSFSARFYEGRYVTGQIAGAMTESNLIGYIAGYPIPQVVRGINAFTLGLHSVNPDARVKVVWINSWIDPEKERAVAEGLIDQGADILTQHTASPAPQQVAEARGALSFGQSSDMSRFAPTAHLTAIVNDWGPYYIERTRAVLSGTWKPENSWHGMGEAMVLLSDFNLDSLPADVIEKAQRTVEAIKTGSLNPFAGPIMGQNGEEIVAAGAAVTDEELLAMDYFVAGVEGTAPE